MACALSSFPRKLAYALKYRELNLLLSDAVNDKSRILDHREPLERVERVAPWLTPDGNPYPAVVDGRVQWIIDGYTTSADYPYSRLTEIDSATSDSVTARSSAVQAIGTRSGQLHPQLGQGDRRRLRRLGEALLRGTTRTRCSRRGATRSTNTVRPMSEISGDLMSHLRYPEDLFKVQRQMLSRYHVTDAASFYGGQDFWEVPEDPAQEQRNVDQPPYYLTLKMPDQDGARFSLTTTFKPVGDRQVLSGFLAVDADAGSTDGQAAASDYGTLRLLDAAQGQPGPWSGPGAERHQLVQPDLGGLQPDAVAVPQQRPPAGLPGHARQPADPARSAVACSTSSRSTSAPTATPPFPLSRATVVAFGDKLAWSDTLDGALDGLFGGNSGATRG